MSSLEDLVVENRRTYSPELTTARAQPVDAQATADLKGDPDRMALLAKLADVEPERIVSVAVRGSAVTFMVADSYDELRGPQGAVSAGYFLLTDLDGSAKAARRRSASRKGTAARSSAAIDTRAGAVGHGSATVPTIASTGGEAPEVPDGRSAADVDADEVADAPSQAVEGVPSEVVAGELNAKETIKLLKDPPGGVDPRAVAAFERSREPQRSSVLKEAEKLGLFEQPAA